MSYEFLSAEWLYDRSALFLFRKNTETQSFSFELLATSD